jgi:putative transcriptional regulator
MTITHHPSDTTLSAFAAGTLDEGQRLVVATHIAGCPSCRRGLQAFEHVAGNQLDGLSPVAMEAGALDTVVGRLTAVGDGGPADFAVQRVTTPATASAEDLPGPLALYDLGPWRWIGRGVYWRPVSVWDKTESRVFMLKAAPGIRLPDHHHLGIEWTCVLAGAFHHDYGRYGPGDFDEADELVAHRPHVETGDPCICLVAMRGGIRFEGWIGRLLQTVVRI